MTKQEKAVLMDVAGMIQQLVDGANHEENKTNVPAEQENHDTDEENTIGEEQIEFIKDLRGDNLIGICFVGPCKDGPSVIHGKISGLVFNAMLDAFIEKYG